MNTTIGVSTWCLQSLTYKEGKQLPEFIEIMARMGIDSLDIYEEYLPVYPNPNLYEINQIKKMAAAVNLPIKSTWFYYDALGSYYAQNLEITIENIKRFIAIAAALGCKFLALPFSNNVPGLGRDEAFETYCKIFEKLIPTAEEYNILICVETARQYMPGIALRVCKKLNSSFFTVCPDTEAWRLETADIPLVHQEAPCTPPSKPESLELFEECLPYSPCVHFKLLTFNEKGEEPHFPIPELMNFINNSPIDHHLCIEYEGWIPDITPNVDSIQETKKCVDLIKRYQKG
ncbi:MAG: sugar phosphate isomerase/epimerase [Bacteroidales bacterium]|jgi:hypothetical protein|nr:sugar phosphate isomerase/epimerase [Bacteroidales bacterium]